MPATALDVSQHGLRISLDVNLAVGSRVEVVLRREVVIFGEVRYSRTVGDRFESGILIQELYCTPESDHIGNFQLTMYVAGTGLNFREIVAVQQHLAQCESCRTKILLRRSRAENDIGLPQRRLPPWDFR